jgi:WD40 repeat protein
LEDASGFWSVVVFADGRRAVSASADDTLKLWDLDTGTCVHIMEGHKWRTESLAVTPDGRRLISGGWDKTLRVWDIDTGRCLLVLEGHTDWVKSVAVTPDGRLVVSGSSDKTIRLWDLESSKCISIARLNATCFPVLLILPLNRVLCGQFNGEVSLFELQGVRLSPS